MVTGAVQGHAGDGQDEEAKGGGQEARHRRQPLAMLIDEPPGDRCRGSDEQRDHDEHG